MWATNTMILILINHISLALWWNNVWPQTVIYSANETVSFLQCSSYCELCYTSWWLNTLHYTIHKAQYNNAQIHRSHTVLIYTDTGYVYVMLYRYYFVCILWFSAKYDCSRIEWLLENLQVRWTGWLFFSLLFLALSLMPNLRFFLVHLVSYVHLLGPLA